MARSTWFVDMGLIWMCVCVCGAAGRSQKKDYWFSVFFFNRFDSRFAIAMRSGQDKIKTGADGSLVRCTYFHMCYVRTTSKKVSIYSYPISSLFHLKWAKLSQKAAVFFLILVHKLEPDYLNGYFSRARPEYLLILIRQRIEHLNIFYWIKGFSLFLRFSFSCYKVMLTASFIHLTKKIKDIVISASKCNNF